MKNSTFYLLITLIILLLSLLVFGIVYILTDNVSRIDSVSEVTNYDMTLEERIAYTNSIPKENWIKIKGKEDNMYFKGKANANNIAMQITEPFEINGDYTVEFENGSERVLLLETSLEGGVSPLRYLQDSDTIEPGMYRLNIVSEYNFKINLRRN